MLISPDEFWGTIGGGQLEFQVIKQARALMEQTGIDALVQDYPLGPLLAQCCGGHVRILIERFDSRDIAWLARVAIAVETGQAVKFEREFKGAVSTRKVATIAKTPPRDRLTVRTLSGEDNIPIKAVLGITEWITSDLPPLYLFGAGHVGTALVRVLGNECFACHWYDEREDFVRDDRGPKLLTDVESVIDAAPPNSLYVIFTQSHDLDYRILRTVLTRGDSLYCGVIGSATKRSRFVRRLERDGLEERDIAHLTCPIGRHLGDGLIDKTPTAIAIGVAYEVLACVEAQGVA